MGDCRARRRALSSHGMSATANMNLLANRGMLGALLLLPL